MVYKNCNENIKPIFISWVVLFFFYLVHPGGNVTGSIYLYALVISDGYQVSVFSMLSEKHDANFIHFWLTE